MPRTSLVILLGRKNKREQNRQEIARYVKEAKALQNFSCNSCAAAEFLNIVFAVAKFI